MLMGCPAPWGLTDPQTPWARSPHGGYRAQLVTVGLRPYRTGAGKQRGAVGCSPTAHTRTLMGAPQARSHAGGVPGGSVRRWMGAGGLSPPPVRLCHGAWGSAPVDAVGCPDPPKFPWGFQPLKSLIKASLYFFPGLGPCLWGVRARHWQGPCPPALGDGGPHPRSPHPEGTHLAGDVGEGAPPVLVPAMGGHLHTGAGMDTPGTVPQFLPHRDHLRTLGLGDPGVWEAMPV